MRAAGLLRRLRAPVFAISSLALAGPAFATTVGHMVQVFVDGMGFTVPLEPVSDKGDVFGSYFMLEDEFRIQLQVYMNPDPDIVYAVAVTDFGAPSSFGFIFFQAIVPVPTPGTVTNTFSSSTTDGGGAAGTPVTALAPPAGISTDGDATAEIVVFSLSTNGGVSWLNAGLDLAPSFVGASTSDVQGPFNEGPAAGPAAAGSFYSDMRLDLNFQMAGGGDAFTFNGRATVIPEPATLTLIGVGLAGLAMQGRRRARRG
jgi:hypothetical protein